MTGSVDVAWVLHKLRPIPLYGGSLTSNTEQQYNNIRWNDPRPKPTWQEILDYWEVADPDPVNSDVVIPEGNVLQIGDQQVNAILNEDTMESASSTAVPTQLSVVNFVNNTLTKVGSILPTNGYYVYEEFLSTNYSGTMNWARGYKNGTAMISGDYVDELHSGILKLRVTNGSSTNYINMRLGSDQVMIGGGLLSVESLFLFEDLANTITNYWFTFGFGDSSSDLPSSGVYFGYNIEGNLNYVEPNWKCITSKNAVKTITNSQVAFTQQEWVKLRIDVDSTDNAQFFINDALVATNTINLPIGKKIGFNVIMGKINSGGYSNYLHWDYFWQKYNYTEPR